VTLITDFHLVPSLKVILMDSCNLSNDREIGVDCVVMPETRSPLYIFGENILHFGMFEEILQIW
jgi:hypothetical protein